MRNRYLWAALLALIVTGVLWNATTTYNTGSQMLQEGIGDSGDEDSEWTRLRGEVNVLIGGTFDGATVSVEVLVKGPEASPAEAPNTGVAGLTGIVAPMTTADRHTADGWVALPAGDGQYRLHVTGTGGSTSIWWASKN